jgi:peptide/nickel transport system substrate-binding protein
MTNRVPTAGVLSRREVLRRGGLVAIAAVGAPIVASCTPGTSQQATQTAQPQEQAVKGGNLVDARNVENKSLLPVLESPLSPVVNAMFESLLTTGTDGALMPLIAASLPKVSADGLTYTFDIRKDVKWSDGRPLTADDVVFTYRTMFHDDYKAFPSYRRADLSGTLADIKATDPYTVVMTTKRLSASFLANQTRDLIIPKHVLGDVPAAALAAHPFGQAPTVSSGPFKFKEWKIGDHMTGVRNELYYRGVPYLDSYVLRLIPDQAAIINGLKTGEIDMAAQTGTFSRYDELKTISNLNFFTYGVGQGPRIWFNLDPAAPASKIFSDKAVRQALWYASDIAGINNAVLFKYGSIPSSTGVFPTAWWPNDPNGKPALAFDKAKAAALLDQAGWRVGAGGVRSKDGTALKFELLTSSDNDAWLQTAQILQQNWKDVGADVGVRAQRFAQLITASLDRTFDVLMQSTPYSQGGNPDPDPSEAYHSRTAVKGARNYSSYKNPQVDTLLDQAISTLDQAKRKEIYAQLQAVMNEDIPSFNTPFWAYGWAANKRVKGIGPDRIGTYTGNRWWMHQVWVTDGK